MGLKISRLSSVELVEAFSCIFTQKGKIFFLWEKVAPSKMHSLIWIWGKVISKRWKGGGKLELCEVPKLWFWLLESLKNCLGHVLQLWLKRLGSKQSWLAFCISPHKKKSWKWRKKLWCAPNEVTHELFS